MHANKNELSKTETSKRKAGKVALVQVRGPEFNFQDLCEIGTKFLSSHHGGGGEERIPVVTG